jgi:hypothetical protein
MKRATTSGEVIEEEIRPTLPENHPWVLYNAPGMTWDEVKAHDGLPSRGTNHDLHAYVERTAGDEASKYAFRGTTKLLAHPGNDEVGACAWAGVGHVVLMISGVPAWDVNPLLEGRIRTADGRFRGNKVHGEQEYAVDARVPLNRIIAYGIVKETAMGPVVKQWFRNEHYEHYDKPLPTEVSGFKFSDEIARE